MSTVFSILSSLLLIYHLYKINFVKIDINKSFIVNATGMEAKEFIVYIALLSICVILTRVL